MNLITVTDIMLGLGIGCLTGGLLFVGIKIGEGMTKTNMRMAFTAGYKEGVKDVMKELLADDAKGLENAMEEIDTVFKDIVEEEAEK